MKSSIREEYNGIKVYIPFVLSLSVLNLFQYVEFASV